MRLLVALLIAGAPAGWTADEPTAAVIATSAADVDTAGRTADELAIARDRREARLSRLIARLERETSDAPDYVDASVPVRARKDAVVALELLDLTAERSALRARIDALRQRITLIEQIEQRQDRLDRARLSEHQRVMTALATERAQVAAEKAETEIGLASAEWLAARHQAKLEMLADLRRQLDAVERAAEIEPVRPPAAAPTVESVPAAAEAAAPAETPAPTPAPAP